MNILKQIIVLLTIPMCSANLFAAAAADSEVSRSANHDAEDFDRPKLVVMVSVDQLRRDRVNDSFPGGLGELVRSGKVFSNAMLDHAVTTTCPGHAVLLTATNPGKAGITNNEFIDRDAWKNRYCVEDVDSSNEVFGSSKQRSPNNLTASTLGDWLKAADKNAKVFAVGGKDRATITMAGHQADGVYWFDSTQAKFTSSRYYLEKLPDYINRYNGTEPLKNGFLAEFPHQWQHAVSSKRIDDYVGEDPEYSRVSGHPLIEGAKEEIGAHVYSSPYVDIASMQLAKKVIDEERLGQRGSTDLLAIALSATDLVGHRYGPFSSESEDTLRTVDNQLQSLLGFLDEKVGKNKYTLVLSADHGVAELPEWSLENGTMQCPVDDGRVGIYGLVFRIYWYVYANFTMPFGDPRELVKMAGSEISINHRYARAHGINVADVVAGLKDKLEQEGSVQKAWTIEEIAQGKSEMARLYRNSYTPGRSGDLFLQLHAGCVIHGDTGTTHGTPYSYDRDIPLIFYGVGVKAGKSQSPAHSVDIATTLAPLLGLTAPETVDGRVLKLH